MMRLQKRIDCTEYLISPLVCIYMVTSSYNNIKDSNNNSFLVSLKEFKVDIKVSSFLGYPEFTTGPKLIL